MITGTTNYDEVPDVRCALCGGYYKADVPESHECDEEAQPVQPCEHSMFWDASGVKRCSKCDLPEHANVHYADAAEMDIAAARQRIAELESSVIAPGILRCTECSFVQTKNIISVTADTITTGNSEPEPCPNGCGQLQPVNWKALAIQLMFTTKQGVSDLLEAKKRIAELEEAEQKLCAANVTLDARAELAERRLAEMESRTVKLPKRSVGEVMHMSGFSRDYAEGWCAGNDNAIHEMRVAGIKVEAE